MNSFYSMLFFANQLIPKQIEKNEMPSFSPESGRLQRELVQPGCTEKKLRYCQHKDPYPIPSMGRLYIYLHEWLIFSGKCIGKYTIHGSYGLWTNTSKVYSYRWTSNISCVCNHIYQCKVYIGYPYQSKSIKTYTDKYHIIILSYIYNIYRIIKYLNLCLYLYIFYDTSPPFF